MLILYYHQILLLKGPKVGTVLLKSVDFGRFMNSEVTETLILTFTSKTGQSVAHNRHRRFSFGFFCQREDIFGHFIGLISDSRCLNK